MPTPKSAPHSVGIKLAAAAAMLVYGFVPSALPQSASSSKQVILVDPTPRERDPHQVFGDDPAELARQQQANALKAAQRRAQAVAAIDQLLVLSKELKAEVGAPTPANSALNARKAEKIEKLAKSVREKMKN